MTTRLLIHPKTQAEIDALLADPAHAILLTGLKGCGKSAICQLLCAGLLSIEDLSDEKYQNHPYIRIVRSNEGKAISIETVRELQHFLSLSVPGSGITTSRIVVIEDAGLMTPEAQNALLKTLEEPPHGTVLLLSAGSFDSVLPTIRSRVRQLAVRAPEEPVVAAYFKNAGHASAAIDAALRISGGLPGLTQALLTEDQDHPLFVATTHARGILQSKAYERLLLVDTLSKQKKLCQDVLYVLGRMSHIALTRATTVDVGERWKKVMKTAYEAQRQLSGSVQAKLVLTNFMLSL